MSLNINNPVLQDFLYTDYCLFFEKFGCKLIYLPNATSRIESYFNDFSIRGVILSGGNDLSSEFTKQEDINVCNSAPMRDLTEKKLLTIAIEHSIPVLGICRGMQFINVYFGGSTMQNIQNEIAANSYHVNTQHSVNICDSKASKLLGKDEVIVNSYHHQGVRKNQIAPCLKAIAISSKDKIIEAVYHPKLPIVGIQWHPERKGSSPEDDKKLIDAFVNRKLYWSKSKQ